jgi:hypothetical protein
MKVIEVNRCDPLRYRVSVDCHVGPGTEETTTGKDQWVYNCIQTIQVKSRDYWRTGAEGRGQG